MKHSQVISELGERNETVGARVALRTLRGHLLGSNNIIYKAFMWYITLQWLCFCAISYLEALLFLAA